MRLIGADEQTRAEFVEQRRMHEAMRSGKPELERSRLTFGRFGTVTHEDGRRFRVNRGEIVDVKYGSYDAWFVDELGRAQFLQETS